MTNNNNEYIIGNPAWTIFAFIPMQLLNINIWKKGPMKANAPISHESYNKTLEIIIHPTW